MTYVIVAFVLTLISGYLAGYATCHIRYVQGLKDARDYAELHCLSAVQAARRAIDDRRKVLQRIHQLYSDRKRITTHTNRYRAVRLP